MKTYSVDFDEVDDVLVISFICWIYAERLRFSVRQDECKIVTVEVDPERISVQRFTESAKTFGGNPFPSMTR